MYESFFLGCIKEVVINNKLSDFLQASRVRHKVSPGCSLYQDQDDEQSMDPCQQHKCQHNAKCVPRKAYGTYECKCVPPYEGKFCELKSKSLLFVRIFHGVSFLYIFLSMCGFTYFENLKVSSKKHCEITYG